MTREELIAELVSERYPFPLVELEAESGVEWDEYRRQSEARKRRQSVMNMTGAELEARNLRRRLRRRHDSNERGEGVA